MKIKLSEIKLNEHNPRDISFDKKEKLKKSIQEFPEMLETRPLIIDENNVVLGGNMRLRVLQELGFKEVPVKQVTGWTEDQKKEFTIKDNVSYGHWDWDMLANEWDEHKLLDWALDIPTFSEDVDYSILDEEDTGDVLQNMTDGVYKSIQIEFKLEDYERAYELCQFARSKKLYIGEFIINLLQDIKDGYDKQN
jgi:ParB-like chromosome segregation protein Spo0J